MTSKFGKLIREPLLHFFVAGALIFVLYEMIGATDEPGADEIVVTVGNIERLIAGWTKTRMRPPTQQELQGLIEEFVREEIYYREAIAMGLEDGDTIIRRRLRQKMEFLSHDLAIQADPTDEDLQEYLEANPDAFRFETMLSFRHVFLSRDRRGESVAEDANTLLEQLRADPTLDTETLGDVLMLPQAVESMRQSEVQRMFGQDFAVQVSALTPGSWQGPVSSSYGVHLVFIDEIVATRLPELGEVREKVETEWRNDRRNQVNEEIYNAFRDRYTVSIEEPDWPEEEASPSGASQP